MNIHYVRAKFQDVTIYTKEVTKEELPFTPAIYTKKVTKEEVEFFDQPSYLRVYSW